MAIQRILDEDDIPQDPATGKRMPLEIAISPTHETRPQPVECRSARRERVILHKSERQQLKNSGMRSPGL